MESMELIDAVSTLAQLAAIKDTFSSTVQAAFQSLPHNDVIPPAPAFSSAPSPRVSSVASPNGLSRPLDKALEDKILRSENVDFSLLLPETLYQTQTPALQLRYEDSPPGSSGSLLTVVKRKKPNADSFQKWLDAFMAYILVIVTAYPNRAVELIKYQQIISRAVTKFKGLAWYTYDEHFRRRAARDLTIAWDRIDIELWTVTFTGTAKPHCSICSSPYHQSDDCPHQEPSKKPRRSALVCFDFNKASGCQRRTCHFLYKCRRCGYSSHALFNCPSSKQHATSTKSATPSDRSKNKVEQRQRKQSLTVSTPLDVDKLALELVNHPNRSFVDNLVNALRYGTRIGYLGPQKFRVSNNLISASQHPEVISANLSKEMSLGRVAGPFLSPPLPNFQCHPIGVVPKKHSTEWRTIYHLSYPPGDSVNDHFPKDPYSLQYVQVDDAISILKSLGPGSQTDLKSSFRIMPIHPDDWNLLGIYWQSRYYVDLYLPFGLRSSPFLFNQISDALKWILKHSYGLGHVIHILEDFFMAESSKLVCLENFSTLLKVFMSFQVPIVAAKTLGPSQVLEFMGIVLDSTRMEARLPEDKLPRISQLLDSFSACRSARPVDLQSLIGTLQFARKVMVPRRTFLQRMINLTRGVPSRFHHFRLKKQFQRDITMWKVFLTQWNGHPFFLDSFATSSGSRTQCRPDTFFHPSFVHDPLKDEVIRYANLALSWNTKCTLTSGEKRFISFCLMNRLISPTGDILPASEGTLFFILFSSHSSTLHNQDILSSRQESTYSFRLQ